MLLLLLLFFFFLLFVNHSFYIVHFTHLKTANNSIRCAFLFLLILLLLLPFSVLIVFQFSICTETIFFLFFLHPFIHFYLLCRVLKGDALITTCFYDTRGYINTTLGGFSISDEMCVNYIQYYPATKLEVCKSSVSEKTLEDYFFYMKRYAIHFCTFFLNLLISHQKGEGEREREVKTHEQSKRKK